MLEGLVIALTIFASHPAQNTDGRLLSVEDAVGSNMGVIHLKRHYWTADGKLTDVRPDEPEVVWPLPLSEGDGIVYGSSVSRNEFGCTEGIFPCPADGRIAAYRKDESGVTQFPLLDIKSRTGSLKSIRYPMNGMKSEELSLIVCDTLGRRISTMQVTDFSEERYLTGVTWTPDGRSILIQVLDREQHHMRLNMYRASDGSFVRTILTENNDAWIEPKGPVHFLGNSGTFIYETDNRDGWRSLYLCDTLGTKVRRLTTCNADTEYITDDGRFIYYYSYEVSPAQQHLFRIEVKNGKPGKPQRLTSEAGWHDVSFNPDKSQFLDRWSFVNSPDVLQLCSADGRLLKVLERAGHPYKDLAMGSVEVGTVKSADGRYDNWYRLIKPHDFDPSRKYPLIVYVYGGPHSQMVNCSWLGNIRIWEMVMAELGYVVYVQDNRGTQHQGTDYEKAINRRCGIVEAEDQMAGISELLKQPWIDTDRVGVHGWSYGGFMTINLVTLHPDIFKVAVAGGPVIDWKWYEIMYGERYMDTPQTNPEGFSETSLINRTQDLKCKLLICQGAIDDTVVWQHSLSFVNKCVEEGTQLDYFPYPTSEHNMRDKARVHLYRKITDYFTNNL